MWRRQTFTSHEWSALDQSRLRNETRGPSRVQAPRRLEHPHGLHDPARRGEPRSNAALASDRPRDPRPARLEAPLPAGWGFPVRSRLDDEVVETVRSVLVHALAALCIASAFFAGFKLGVFLVMP